MTEAMNAALSKSVDTIHREIKRHEKDGVKLPIDVGARMVEALLDPTYPKEPNKKSKIVIVRAANGRLKKEGWRRTQSPTVPNEFFCDIIRFDDFGKIYSYSLDDTLHIRDEYLTKKLHRSMYYGYIIGRFGFNGVGRYLSLKVVDIFEATSRKHIDQ